MDLIEASSDPNDAETGGGCARRGYKLFLRLLREFIEVTEYENDVFEDNVEIDVEWDCDEWDVRDE